MIASAPKAAYLPPGIFVYDGSAICKPFSFMITYLAVAYAIDILEMFALRWKNGKFWLVAAPQQGFSLYRLLLHLGYEVANPFVMAAIVSGPAYEASAINELALFLMAPRASPIIALICAFIPGWRGFGAQQLAGDILFAFITIFGWGVVPGTAIETTHGEDAGAPTVLITVYNTGVQLAVMPNWLVICLVILIVSCTLFFSSKGNRTRRAGYIVAFALFVGTVIASMPFVALYEFILGFVDRRVQRTEYALIQQQQQQQQHQSEAHRSQLGPNDLVMNNITSPSDVELVSDKDNMATPRNHDRRGQLSNWVTRFVPKYFHLPGPEVEAPKPHLGWLKSIFRIFFPVDSPKSRARGYAILLASSFCITIGNWMATVTLLYMAGESFCPSNIWALVLAKFGISLSRILLDLIHVP